MAMKSTIVNGLVATVFVATTVGCGGPLHYMARGTARAPDSDGEITADVNRDQQNTRLNLRLQHLAPPDRIASGANSYVVWTRGANQQWVRVGSLAYNPGDREGRLEGMAPFTAFELNITAENTAAPAVPSQNVVLVQRVGSN